MTVLIQNEQPEALPEGTYWLQSPGASSADDTFYLFLRVYIPEPSISVTQSWVPPQIMRNDMA